MISTDGSAASQLLEARHHTYGIFGLQQEWFSGELTLSAEELARFLYEHTPDFLKKAFQEYSFQSARILSNAGTGK